MSAENMTGPDHYREAERLLALAEDGDGPNPDRLVQMALVHQGLAQAAATALNAAAAIRAASGGWAFCSDDVATWQRAVGGSGGD